jgi:hypothetical protein
MNPENKNLDENAPIVNYPRQQIQLPFEPPLLFDKSVIQDDSIPESNSLMSIERPSRYTWDPTISISEWSVADTPGKKILDKTFTTADFITLLKARGTSEYSTHMQYTGNFTVHIERKRNIQHQGIFAVALLPPEIFHNQVDRTLYKTETNLMRLINYFNGKHYNASGNSTISIPISQSDLFARHFTEHTTALTNRPIIRLLVLALTPLRTTSDYTSIDFKVSTTWEDVSFNVLVG